MKLIHLFVFVCIGIVGACKQNTSADKTDTTTNSEEPLLDSTGLASPVNGEAFILFYEDKHDFGTVLQGEKVFYSFKFKNIGNSDLIISTARGSCGCTVPTYPKKPIKAGAEGKIDVVFNSENLIGISQKTITVLTNSNPNGISTLTINANVIAPVGEKQ